MARRIEFFNKETQKLMDPEETFLVDEGGVVYRLMWELEVFQYLEGSRFSRQDHVGWRVINED